MCASKVPAVPNAVRAKSCEPVLEKCQPDALPADGWQRSPPLSRARDANGNGRRTRLDGRDQIRRTSRDAAGDGGLTGGPGGDKPTIEDTEANRTASSSEGGAASEGCAFMRCAPSPATSADDSSGQQSSQPAITRASGCSTGGKSPAEESGAASAT